MSSGKTARPVATPSVTRQLMQTHAVSAKKSLGQNFIIEPQVIADIVAAAGCDKQDLVLEIGPGLGSLTQSLSASGQPFREEYLIGTLDKEIWSSVLCL